MGSDARVEKTTDGANPSGGYPTLGSVENKRVFSHVIARAWADEEFRSRLLAEPETVLAEYSLQLPDGVQVKVVENTPEVVHFILPMKPPELEGISLEGKSIHLYDTTKCDGPCDCGTQK